MSVTGPGARGESTRLGRAARSRWAFLTNHGAVLVYLAVRPNETMRSIAAALGLTERTMATVISELHAEGYISVQRRGRRNHYTVNLDMPLRRSVFTGLTLGAFVSALRLKLPPPPPDAPQRPAGEPRRRRTSRQRTPR